MNHAEHDQQVYFFQWAALHERYYPELIVLYAIPNGGLRHWKVASDLKDEGVKAGVLDVHLPVARHNYFGLWIEFKAGKNKCTDDQLCWASLLTELGHCVQVCYSWNEAADVVAWYLT